MNDPKFTIRAKDDLAIATLIHYRGLCRVNGLHRQVTQVQRAIDEFREWRIKNPEACKMPDHEHGTPLSP